MKQVTLFCFLMLASFMLKACSPQQQQQTAQQTWQAACDGRLSDVRTGIQAGVPVDYQGDSGFTGLICAAENGHLDVVEYLIGQGADVNNTANTRHKPALLAAAFKSHNDIVDWLLANTKADVNWQAINMWTALHDAAYVGDLHASQALLNHGASTILLNDRNETALQTAQRAITECQSQSKACPITQGLTTATLADFQNVVKLLTR